MNLTLHQATVIGHELAVSFSCGLETYIPLEILRKACPCATCKGEPDVTGKVFIQPIQYGPRSFELLKIDWVGGYALQPHWGDAHSSGIYAYEYLLAIQTHLAATIGTTDPME